MWITFDLNIVYGKYRFLFFVFFFSYFCRGHIKREKYEVKDYNECSWYEHWILWMVFLKLYQRQCITSGIHFVLKEDQNYRFENLHAICSVRFMRFTIWLW